MDSLNFCYWIQGYFEITNPKEIGVKETETIYNHLKLTLRCDDEPEKFVVWLNGYYELAKPKSIDRKTTQLIKDRLNSIFQHEIDPLMGGPEIQEELNKIHTPNYPHNDTSHSEPGIIRC